MEDRKVIVDGNKLIAEFMGLYQRKGKTYPYPFGHPTKEVNYLDGEYHSDWNWLMPVVEKIEGCFEGSISVNIYDERCTIEISTQYAMATDIHLPSEFYNNEGPKIKSTWLSVIEFIQWYNANEKNNNNIT